MFDVGFLLNRKMKKTLEFAFYSHLEIFKTDLLALVNSDCLTEDTFITAKRKYTQSVLDYMMNSIENVGASSHIRKIQILHDPSACGFDFEWGELNPGLVYACVYFVLTGKQAESAPCIYFNHFVAAIIDTALQELDKQV